ncbi:serine hydrolase [Mucisphaera calidilacus]|uniref:Beta-lactamase class A catalytic domain-containing protein n=1 Tax=Mucisphaera calidilacus TaxID=2527982 RepID=A0A518C195_9BACT|nr:serine hydrolase [Mucisphaera calidilacus]QDU72992.1 hypothetical protein Pan265_28700 [Mucisphaera calidilacus]
MGALTDPSSPWLDLPEVSLPIVLEASAAGLDELVDLPEGSALTLARVDRETATVRAARWRDTGSLEFYPASTIKLATVALALGVMDRYGWDLDTVIEVGDDLPISLRRLLASTIVLSSNSGFCTLHELVGTRETHEAMRSWGIKDSIVRRHFRRPAYSHSRVIKAYRGGEVVTTIPERPAFDAEPETSGVKTRSNVYTTDDFCRLAAAVLAGPDVRGTTFYNHLPNWLSLTNHSYVAEGLGEVTGKLAGHPAFVTLNKPGWWPGTGAVSEVGYIYDVQMDEHYVFGVYHQGTLPEAHVNTMRAFEAVFTAIHRDGLRL